MSRILPAGCYEIGRWTIDGRANLRSELQWLVLLGTYVAIMALELPNCSSKYRNSVDFGSLQWWCC